MTTGSEVGQNNTGAMIAYFLAVPIAEDLAAFVRARTANTLTPDSLVSASDMHVTIAFFGDADDLSPNAIKAIQVALATEIAQLGPLFATLNGVGRFVDNDPNALVANFDCPGLAVLRERAIHALREAGVQPVLNHGYSPHVTLAYIPEETLTPDLRFTPISCAVDHLTLALGNIHIDYPLVGEVVVSETTQTVIELRLSTPDFTFKGAIPDVPLAPGVDYNALIAIQCPTCAGHDPLCQQCSGSGNVPDPHPLFVVRPLGILNAVSDNGLRYDQGLLDQIREQIVDKKPSGRQGHVSEEDASWAFPDDIALWVGAAQHGDTLFAKAFIYPNTPFHEMIVKRKAAGSTISNSIWGKGEFQPNGDGTQRLRNLNLESIDFAPAERAALQVLGGKFKTTSELIGVHEMADSEITPALLKEHIGKMKPEEVHGMLSDKHKDFTTTATLADKTPATAAKMLPEGHLDAMTKSRLAEMEPEDVYEMLPKSSKKPIADAYCAEFGQTMSSKDATEGVTEMNGAMQKRLAEMERQTEANRTIIAEYQRREYEQTVDAMVDKFVLPDARVMATQKGKEIVASLKTNFRMHVVAQMAGSTKAEDLQAAAERAWPMFKPLAEMSYAALSGPSVTVSANGANKTADVKRATPEEIKRAQAEMGL